jgi:hypothetical protein
VTLYRQDHVTIVTNNLILPATIGTQTDTSGTVGAYDDPHTITLSGLTEVISANNQLVVSFEGETGANSQANSLALYALALIVDPS